MDRTGSDPELKKLRKYESILVISGSGTIAFGLWSIIRAGIYYFLNPLDIAGLIGESELAEIMADGEEHGVEIITDHLGAIVTGFILFLMMIDLLLRIYVGMSARAFGRGRKKTIFFIFLTWFMAAFTLFGVIVATVNSVSPLIEAIRENTIEAYLDSPENSARAADVSIFVDFTSLLVLIELAVSAMKVRKMRRQLGINDRKGELKDYYDDLADLTEGIRSITGDN